MRRNIEKILAAASAVIAIVLVVILLVTTFGGIKLEEFENALVRGLFVTLAAAYILLTVLLLTLMFTSSDAVKEIVLRNEHGNVAKTTLGVIHKLVKTACKKMDGVKSGKVSLISNEYGAKLKVSVKVKGHDAAETEILIRTTLEELFAGALGFRFHTIEIKVVSLQARFVPDQNKVDQIVAERVAERKAELEAEEALAEEAEVAAKEFAAEEGFGVQDAADDAVVAFEADGVEADAEVVEGEDILDGQLVEDAVIKDKE